jgi:hypothetical protein
MESHDDDDAEAGAGRTGPASRDVSVRLALLDTQIVDADDLPIGRVDDVEIDLGADDGAHPPIAGMSLPVVAVLTGQRHLGPRIGGLTGEIVTRISRRLSDDADGGRIDPEDVASWTGMVKMRDRLSDLDLAPVEKWLSARVVRRIPGGDDEGL